MAGTLREAAPYGAVVIVLVVGVWLVGVRALFLIVPGILIYGIAKASAELEKEE